MSLYCCYIDATLTPIDPALVNLFHRFSLFPSIQTCPQKKFLLSFSADFLRVHQPRDNYMSCLGCLPGIARADKLSVWVHVGPWLKSL